MPPGPKIFLSYRRDDSAFQTTAIHEKLVEVFGAGAVFMDVDNIPAGRDFRSHLQLAIAGCDVCLAVIGEQWLSACDEQGQRRLEDPRDFVRIELEAALARGIPVIPLLVGKIGVPPVASLPESLAELSYRHAVSIRPGRDFRNDTKLLIEQIAAVPGQQTGKAANTGGAPSSSATPSKKAASGVIPQARPAQEPGSQRAQGAKPASPAASGRPATSPAANERVTKPVDTAAAPRRSSGQIPTKPLPGRKQPSPSRSTRPPSASAAAVEATRGRPRSRSFFAKLLLLSVCLAGVIFLAVWIDPRIVGLMTALIRSGQEGMVAGEVRADNGLSMKLVWCPPGSFTMGSPKSEHGHVDNEEQVSVTLTKGFWLGKYEVTQEEYVRVMGKNPSYFSAEGERKNDVSGQDTERFPVENLSWGDAVEFCRVFTDQERQAGRLPAGWAYTLPTEAQWEYACRAGTTDAFSFGNILNGQEANCDGNSPYGTESKGPYLDRTTTVGSYKANRWGLCDMHGNVSEYCRDKFAKKLPGGTDPLAMSGEEGAIDRGGSWNSPPLNCRSSSRIYALDVPRSENLDGASLNLEGFSELISKFISMDIRTKGFRVALIASRD